MKIEYEQGKKDVRIIKLKLGRLTLKRTQDFNHHREKIFSQEGKRKSISPANNLIANLNYIYILMTASMIL